MQGSGQHTGHPPHIVAVRMSDAPRTTQVVPVVGPEIPFDRDVARALAYAAVAGGVGGTVELPAFRGEC